MDDFVIGKWARGCIGPFYEIWTDPDFGEQEVVLCPMALTHRTQPGLEKCEECPENPPTREKEDDNK